MKIKFLIAALFFSLVAAAQPSNYIKFNTRGRWIAGMFDSTLHLPAMATNSLKTGGYTGAGAMVYNTTDSSVYTWTGYQWVKLGSSGWALTGNAGTDTATNFIGTTDSVAFLLKVNNLLAGQIDINQKNTSFGQEALLNRNTGGTNNVAIGYRALNKLTNADNNVAVGRMSLGNLTSGNQNTAVGVSALSSIIAQVGNTAIGYQSQLNSTAQINTSVGHSSLLSNTSGVSNTAMGYQAMFSNTTGGANTVMGEGSLYNNTTGSNNTAIGYQALSGTADYNTSVGSQSLRSNISGGFNTSVGYYSLGDNTTGYSNAAIGMNAGRFNTTGFQNSFIGTAAGEDNTTGQENTFVGYDAGLRNTTGIRNTSLGWNGFADNFTGGQNVGIGYGAGKTITNGNNNTILGAFAAWDAAQNDTITGAVIIGHSATASEDSTVVLGNDYIKKTHLKGVVYAPFTTGDATTSDSALVVDRSTGALIMRPVAGGGTYTFTNGLTNSSGTVKLGGTLTEHTTIDGNNKIFEYVDGNSFTIGVTDQIQILSNANGFETNSTSATIKATGTGKESMIIVSPDSIAYNPHLGVMRIDTLAAASNMTNKRVMTWDTVTKRWEQISKDSVGGTGGSTSPAGSTKQIQYNNAGSFGGAAGFEYQSGSSPNVTITGQNAAHVPLYVKGIGSTQTADLFRVMRYDDSAMFRIAANGSVTLGPQYDYVNAHHAPEHVFKYSNSGYTGGIKLRNHNSGSEVRLHTVNNGLYLTDNGGTAAPMTLGTRTNPADASTFIAASGVWTISAGRFGVGGTADASAIIAATSTTKGFLPPKMTGTQAEAISSPAEGLLVYATDGSGSTITTKGWWGYDGAAWVKLN